MFLTPWTRARLPLHLGSIARHHGHTRGSGLWLGYAERKGWWEAWQWLEAKRGSKIWETFKAKPLFSYPRLHNIQFRRILLFPSAHLPKIAHLPPLSICFRQLPDSLNHTQVHARTHTRVHARTHPLMDTAQALVHTLRIQKIVSTLKHLQRDRSHWITGQGSENKYMVNISRPRVKHSESNPSSSLQACVVLSSYLIFPTLAFLIH